MFGHYRSRAAQRGQGQIWLVWGLIAVVVVFAGLVGVGVYVGAKRHQETKQELQALRETGNELIEQQRRLVDGKPVDGKSPGGADAPTPRAGTTVPARNDTEMLRGFNAILREVGARSQHDQGRIVADVLALKLEDVLTPQRLVSAQGRSASRETLRRYNALIDRSSASADQARAELRRRLEVLVSQLPNRDKMLAKYESSSMQRLDLEKQHFRNQREVADLSLQAVELIERAGRRVQIEQGQLAFSSQRELDAFNDLLLRIQAAGREEERLTRLERDLLQRAQAEFDKIARN